MNAFGRLLVRTRWFVSVSSLFAFSGVSVVAQGPSTNTRAAAPQLVVFITVDQMRYDYLERFAGQFKGGLARLTRGGAVFTNGFQDHANSETAPGHATTLSGREPYRTGIILNSIGVPDPHAPLIGGGGPGASPYRFRGGTLIDWMRMKDARSRALSVSRKDRGAILPVGRAHEGVYWYATDGRFTTSSYYADTLPSWVQRFNARRLPQSYAGKAWELLLPESAYPERDSVPIEDFGREMTFPHRLSADTTRAAAEFIAFPWMDELTVDFALDGVQALQLGAGPATDLLAVSLSTTDAIGHRFGIASREIHDQILRLDRVLGVFLDSLYKVRDSSTVVVALTADHGATLPPELAVILPNAPPPTRVDLTELATKHWRALVSRGLDTSAFHFEDAMLFLDRAAFARANISADSEVEGFVHDAKQELGVARADLFSAILKADTVHDPVARRWRHAIPADIPVAVVVTLVQGSVWGSYAPGIHGSPYDDDCHVPLILFGRPFKAGKYGEFARVVDLAPTLAWIQGVTPTESLDGHVLKSALR